MINELPAGVLISVCAGPSTLPTSLHYYFLWIKQVFQAPLTSELVHLPQAQSAVKNVGLLHHLSLDGSFSGLVWKHRRQMNTNPALRLWASAPKTLRPVRFWRCINALQKSAPPSLKPLLFYRFFLAWELLFFYVITTIYSQSFRHLCLQSKKCRYYISGSLDPISSRVALHYWPASSRTVLLLRRGSCRAEIRRCSSGQWLAFHRCRGSMTDNVLESGWQRRGGYNGVCVMHLWPPIYFSTLAAHSRQSCASSSAPLHRTGI